MKITFSNLGSIKKTTLDLRPLTVIIGPNNSNKTYIAYSIYGLVNLSLDSLKLGSQLNFQRINSTKISLKIDAEFYALIRQLISEKIESFKKNIGVFFQDSSNKIFRKTNFELDFTLAEFKDAISDFLRQEKIPFSTLISVSYEKGTLYFEPVEKNNLQLIINEAIESRKDDVKVGFMNLISHSLSLSMQIVSLIIAIVEKLIGNNSILLPAERNAFIITYKMLSNRRYKLLRQSQRELFGSNAEQRQIALLREQGDIRYPQPIEDFLDFLTDAEFDSSDIEDSDIKPNIKELADIIERLIQGNNKTNFKATRFGGREIKINVKKGLDIDLYNASSSIKQLAPLLLYLRYRAQEGDLLIIDEPEMNLHPESQAKLLEVLGMLVNAGVNVLLTTHSPYFMSHLNNLVSGKTDDENVLKEQAKSLYLGDERAFLKMEDVSAYEMKNNKLKDLKDKDYGIRWDTLSDVSADIQQKFFEIYEKGKETSAEDEV